jgi:hypothetical protein
MAQNALVAGFIGQWRPLRLGRKTAVKRHIKCDWAQFQPKFALPAESWQVGKGRSRFCQIMNLGTELLLVRPKMPLKTGDFSQSQIIWFFLSFGAVGEKPVPAVFVNAPWFYWMQMQFV